MESLIRTNEVRRLSLQQLDGITGAMCRSAVLLEDKHVAWAINFHSRVDKRARPPRDEPPVDVHTRRNLPPQYLQNDWLERLFKNLSVYSIVSFFYFETLCVADTKACSLITRSQLTNYCVMPPVVSDQSDMSDILKSSNHYIDG